MFPLSTSCGERSEVVQEVVMHLPFAFKLEALHRWEQPVRLKSREVVTQSNTSWAVVNPRS